MNGLKQFFVSYKTVFVRDKSEFIRFVAQDKDQQATQIVYPDFLAASDYDKPPEPVNAYLIFLFRFLLK